MAIQRSILDATLKARNFDLAGSVVNLGAVPAGTSGLDVSPSLLAAFVGAQSVTLRSASVIDLFDAGSISIGNASDPIGTLTFDSAGLFSEGGTTNIIADNVTLTDSQGTPNTTGALTGANGTLSINASGTVTLGAGATTLGNFAAINLDGGQQIVFAGSGSTAAGSANVQLIAPDVVVAVLSTQSLTTTGAINIAANGGMIPAIDPTDAGGALTLTGASINDSGRILALAGNLTLQATSGDIILANGAMIIARGTEAPLFTQVIDAPAGFVSLTANQGNVTLANGSSIDVSGVGSGAGGTLSINAQSGTVTLAGVLNGATQPGAAGAQFALNAGTFNGNLPQGFGGSIEVETHQGNIDINSPLTSPIVSLTADNGEVIVSSTIDASGASGGTIGLFGADGVDIQPTAQLLANATGAGQAGGSITLGSNGIWDGSTLNADGSEAFSSAGLIDVEAGSTLNVSAGAGGTGGGIIVRTALLTSNDVNVSFNGNVIGASAVVLDAYHTWSTTDPVTDASGNGNAGTHFDGIVDPAGWFDSNGNLVSGTFTDINGNTITYTAANGNTPASLSNEPGATPAEVAADLQADLTNLNNGFFTPATADAAHVTFYQTTLVDFVENPFNGNDAAVAAHFASVSPSLLALRPEMVLQNPTPSSGPTSINSGNITVASNWNLGAGTIDSGGNIQLVYRTSTGQPGVVTLRAANNVQINATVSDGFFETNDPFFNGPMAAPVGEAETFATVSSDWLQVYECGTGRPLYKSKQPTSLYGSQWRERLRSAGTDGRS